jgi:hypothetical protein
MNLRLEKNTDLKSSKRGADMDAGLILCSKND